MSVRADRWRRMLAETSCLLAVVAVLAATAAAFAPPWLSASAGSSGPLADYYPLEDGQAWLQRTVEDGGAPSFQSTNVRRVPALTALAGWRDAPRQALRSMLRDGNEVDDAELVQRFADADAIELHSATLTPPGEGSTSVAYAIRTRHGDWLAGVYFPQDKREVVYEPPIRLTSSRLSPGERWSSTGRVGAGTYEFTARVATEGSRRVGTRRFTSCLRVESTLATSFPDGAASSTDFVDWYCADADSGLVESRSVPDVGATRVSTLVADDAGGRFGVPGIHAAKAAAAEAEPGPLERWTPSRWGRAAPSTAASESTIRPVYVPGPRPVVLTAAYGQGLAAFDAAEPDDVAWRFFPRGEIYGQPGVDPRDGSIFVGTTGKRLYKLSATGMFLWAHRTGDNVAARPTVVGDVAVVAAEDGSVTGLDAASGAVRWRQRTAGSLVSSPAVWGGTVALGSDSGAVYSFEASSGRLLWRYDVGAPVEAPLAAHDGAFLVAGSTGTLTALDAATGEQRWAHDTTVDQRSGPVVSDDRVLLVDDSGGWLAAYDATSGRHLWTSSESGLVGPALLMDDVTLVAGEESVVLAFDAAGRRVARWQLTEGAVAGDGPASLTYGLSSGGGGVWVSDDSTVLRRLGAPLPGLARSLTPRWTTTLLTEPFDGSFDTTPAAWRDAVLLLDHSRAVYRVDPASGRVERLGTMPGEGFAATGPVVSGDVVLAVGRDGLDAATLPELEPLWHLDLEGPPPHPAIVAGGLVLLATADAAAPDGTATGTLRALDLGTGQERWRAGFGDVVAYAGLAVVDDVVYAGTGAFELSTGRRLWSAEASSGLPAGGVAVTSDVVVTTTLDPRTQTAWLVAREPDGVVRWSTETAAADVTQRPWVTEDVAVFATVDGDVVAHDLVTGRRRWSWSPPAAQLYGGITVAGERVWVMTADARVYALHAASGEPVASFTALDVPIDSTSFVQRPQPVGDVVVVPLGYALLALDVSEAS